MSGAVFATAVVAFCAFQGWALAQLLGLWAGPVGFLLGLLEGWAVWSWVLRRAKR